MYKTGTNYLRNLTADRNKQRQLPLQLDVPIVQLFMLMMTIITHHFLAFLKELMIEALCFIFSSLLMAWLSQYILDQSCALIPTSPMGRPTQQRRALEYLVHMFFQGHATHTMHSYIHNLNTIFTWDIVYL
jgi:hypothetical protein